MKKFVVLFAFVFCAVSGAWAQSYVFVNSETIFKSQADYNSAIKQLDDLSAEYQKNIDDAYAELDETFNNYAAQRGYLSETSRQNREEQIVNREKEIKKYQQDVFGPEGELMAERGPLSVATGVIALICLLFVFAVLSLEHRAQGEPGEQDRPSARRGHRGSDTRMVNVVMADGRTKRTESAVSRWLNVSMAWNEKSPEQKLATVIRWFAGVGVFCVFLAVVFGDRVFSPDSVFAALM